MLALMNPCYAWEKKTNLTIKTLVSASTGLRVYFNESASCGTANYLVIETTDQEYLKQVLAIALSAYALQKPVNFYADVGATNCSGSQYFSYSASGMSGLW